jgi:hypothetical protein
LAARQAAEAVRRGFVLAFQLVADACMTAGRGRQVLKPD